MTNKVKEIRLLKKLTQKQLAETANVSYSYIQKIENGVRTSPRLEYAIKISEALEVDLELLFSY